MSDLNFNSNIDFPSLPTLADKEATAKTNEIPFAKDFSNRVAQTQEDTVSTMLTNKLAIQGTTAWKFAPNVLARTTAEWVGPGHSAPDPEGLTRAWPTQEALTKYMDENNVPLEMRSAIVEDVHSPLQLHQRVENLKIQKGHEERMAGNGTIGATGAMTGAFLDPATLIAFGGAGAAFKGVAVTALKGAKVAGAAKVLSAGKAGFATEMAGAALGGVGIGALDSQANYADFTVSKAVHSGLEAMAGQAIFSGMAKGLKVRTETIEAKRLLEEQAIAAGKTPSPKTNALMDVAKSFPGAEAVSNKVAAWKQTRNIDAAHSVMADHGAPVNPAVTDALVHRESTPVDPHFTPKEGILTEGPRHRETDLYVDKDMNEGVSKAATEARAKEPIYIPEKDLYRATAADKATFAKVKEIREDPMGHALREGEPFVSEKPHSRISEVKWSQVDGGPIKLRFETKVDRDLFHVSFPEKPSDFTSRMGRLQKAYPHLDEADIQEMASHFRTEVLRPYVKEFHEYDSLDIPEWHTKAFKTKEEIHTDTNAEALHNEEVAKGMGVGAKLASLGLIGGGLALASTEANASTGGAMGGGAVGGALSAVAGVALKVASKGKLKGKPGVAPKIVTHVTPTGTVPPIANTLFDTYMPKSQTGRYGDYKFTPKAWKEVQAFTAERGNGPGNSESNTARVVNSLFMTPASARAGRGVTQVGHDLMSKTLQERRLSVIREEGTIHREAFGKEKGMSPFFADWKEAQFKEFHDTVAAHKKDPTLNTSPAARKMADSVWNQEQTVAREFIEIFDQTEAAGVRFELDSPPRKYYDIAKNPSQNYIHQVFNTTALEDMLAAHGPEVNKMFRNAVAKAHPGKPSAETDIIADGYLKVISQLRINPQVSQMIHVDPAAALEQFVKNGWVDPKMAEGVLELFAMAKTDSINGVTKARVIIDREHVHTYTDSAGIQKEIRMGDIYSTNIPMTFMHWNKAFSNMQATVAVSQRAGVDLSRNAVIETLIDKAIAERASAADIKGLRDAIQLARGERVDTDIFGGSTEVVRIALGASLLMFGKNFMFSVIPEGLATAFGAIKAASHVRAFPGWGEILRMIAGKSPGNHANRDILAATGMGAEGIGSMFVFNMEQGAIGRGMEKVTTKTTRYNLLTQMNNIAKLWHARGLMQFARDIYTNHHIVTPLDIQKSLHYYGIDRDMLDRLGVLSDKHGKFDKHGILEEMNFNGAHSDDPLLMLQTSGALRKHASLSASEPASFGSTAEFMDHDIGRILFQFMQPLIIGTNNLVRDIGNISPDVLGKWTMSILVAGMSYTTRTTLNYWQDPEELHKRLRMTEIFKAAYRNSMLASFIPSLIDSGMYMTGNEPVFSNVTARGGPSIVPPITAVPGQLMNTIKTGGKLITGQEVTSGELSRGASAINPLLVVQGFVNAIVQAFPNKHTERKPYKAPEE